ncbi:MAG: helix-turn-helix transcriptional regulator [Myxococcota bacterium]
MSERESDSAFGLRLRAWRRARGFSQLDLSIESGISPRHLSFLETGRCGPSRETVVSLCTVLGLPGVETRRMLILAGLSADWGEPRIAPADGCQRLARMGHLLAAHDPLPALLTAPDWSIATLNRSCDALLRRCDRLAGGDGSRAYEIPLLVSDAARLPRVVANWESVVLDITVGIYSSEPDPDTTIHTSEMLATLGQRGDGVLATAATSWEPRLQVRDDGHEFELDLVVMPFAGAWSGYALTLGVASDATETSAFAYFRDRIDDERARASSA